MRFIPLLALLTATPAAAQPSHVTLDDSADEVRGQIAAACLEREWFVDEVEDATVKCIRPGVPSHLVVLGPRGARWAVIVEFTLVGLTDRTMVQVREYIEVENRLGRKTVHRDEPDGEPDQGLALLREIGAR